MKIDPEEIACLDLDPQREAEVAAWLRRQEDVAKFEFVWRVLRRNAGLGFALAKNGQLKPIFLEAILEHGFVYADASGIRFVLEAVVGQLGPARIVRLVRKHLGDAPLVVDKCLYWLPSFCESDPRAMEDLRSLRAQFETQYPSFRSTRSTGIHATGV